MIPGFGYPPYGSHTPYTPYTPFYYVPQPPVGYAYGGSTNGFGWIIIALVLLLLFGSGYYFNLD
ncbi:hypothetical protein NC797_10240 [Aquibacillus sp. 3ASR75-11]|uniref:Uncharacterized protein n=1 Tax=Terrihalobacillus insolitus TaxID=2950438 RepID=A0A9X3WU55_9BACI|nr:hypothetical protein [Terrihalobacillus insolitus]MDC3424888.1 hypothetical protein [Terrihalobacillus insolitus]